ncbi:hypothetical protein ACJMK2_031247 [Sinanodonta woodiana]|uniref:Uncharacterized protein n=1 Tax=Sinanodonta woodiana TaxID=1069815 RepID=A0ABD3WYP1_SINWO
MGSLNGNDVFVSQSPNSCTKTQNTTSVPVIANGTSLGAFMYLRAYNTCRFETPSTNTSTTNVGSAAGGVTTNVSAEAKVTTPNVGAIVGGICGVLFLILLVGSVILFYLCVLKKTPTKKLLKEKYTNGEIAERKQSTPYREDKKENSLAKANVERSNNTEVISTKRVEENKIIQETGEKIHFTDQFLFSKEGTGLDVTQKPPMETAYRQTPIFDRDRSNIMFVVKENIPEKTLDSKAPKTDINSSSVMVTPAGNMTKTMGDAGPLVYRSLSPLLDKAHVISISKANQEDESKRFTSNATFALSVTSTRPTRFRESDKSTEHVQEYPETDSARDSSDEDAKPDDVEAEHVQTPMDTQVQSVDSTPSQMAKSLQKNAVSGFNKHGGLPPLGFDSPSNKSHKHKKRRKKKRKNKFKVSPSD